MPQIKCCLILFLVLTASASISAQFWNGQDSVFGNEWIEFDQNYLKIELAEDGIYRVSQPTLANAGIDINSIEARFFQLWHLGEEVAMYASTDGLMNATDHFLFYGEQNRGEIDPQLYNKGEEDQLNPYYSLITDTTAYYLTWNTSGSGKRVFNIGNDLSNHPPKEEFYTEEIQKVYTNQHFKYSADQGGQLVFSIYDNSQGYGFFSDTIFETFNPTHVFANGEEALLEARVSNNIRQSVNSGQLSINVNGKQVFAQNVNRKPSITNPKIGIDLNDVFSGMEIKIKGNRNSDFYAVSHMRLLYPRQFNFDQSSSHKINVGASTSKKYIEVNDFKSGSSIWAWDLTNDILISSQKDTNDIYPLVIPENNFQREILLLNPETEFKEVSVLNEVTFRDYTTLDPEFIILTHPDFFSDGQGNNPVMEYAQYRRSEAGGDYKVSIINVLDLYEQFAYGIKNHPGSIRNFTQWFSKKWDSYQYMFIIGKGIEYPTIRNNPNHVFHFIPTYGIPASDNLMLSDKSLVPILPSGRLPVISADEIRTYLNKVVTHEGLVNSPQTIEDRAWRKRVIHLSGGDLSRDWELSLIRAELDQMKTVIENSMFGADLTTFQKQSTGTVVTSQSQELRRLVNEGVSIITYFGHSAVHLIDFQIVDDVNILKNKDRYHVLMTMGCYAGNLYHGSRRSYSEKWTLADERGAIAAIANSSAGFIGSLEQFGKDLYEGFGNKLYGESIGLSVLNAVGNLIENNRDSTNTVGFTPDTELAFSLNICGDPAIRLLLGEGPDYTIDPSSVNIEENIITLDNDSLSLKFNAVNIGQAITDSIYYKIEQTLPSGEKIVLSERQISAPFNTDSVEIKIPNLGEKAIGLNKLNITIDSKEEIDELRDPEAEQNNDLFSINKAYCFYVTSDDVRPVYPENFSIVNSPDFSLISSTSDSRASQNTYLIEVDTTETFDSPSLTSTSIVQDGGVVDWDPGINWQDNTVYYWRVSPDSTGKGQFTWRNSSFVYINNNPQGWNQSHYYQYLNNDFRDIEIDNATRKWKFIDDFQDIKIRNIVFNGTTFERALLIRNVTVFWDYYASTVRGKTTYGGVFISVFDPETVTALQNPSPGLYGSINNSGRDLPIFAFDTRMYEGRVALIDFLENEVPDDHFIAFVTIQEPHTDYGASMWEADIDSTIGTNIYQIMNAQGASLINNIKTEGSVPYACVYQKNNNAFETVEEIAKIDESLELNASLPGNWIEGDVNSVKIGPSQKWEKFVWKRSEENINSDIYFARIYGHKSDDSKDLLFDNIVGLEQDLSSIDALIYPNMSLEFFAQDSIDRSPAQLDHWRIHYQGYPEMAVNPAETFVLYKDTLEQGEDFSLTYRIENIGAYDLDSVLVKYTITSSKNNTIISNERNQPLKKGEEIDFTFIRNTLDLQGEYTLQVELNPNEDQKERFHYNNLLVADFFVRGDYRNPLLDVTFDGLHILDGDLVSASPEIILRLTDENKFLALDDTSLFKLELYYPFDNSPRKIDFSDPDITFYPADPTKLDQKNEATIIINKRLPLDGIYRLAVNANDKSGNTSGDFNYQISFEVVSVSSISEIINYPNPFSTSTQFVYTLTGDKTPDFFKIQILTVSGKVVREITGAEIGPLRIGKHMTDYAWDGTDAYGEKLANGVYLYRVIAKNENGEEIKARKVGISNYFKNGWGKMVILR